MIWGRHIHVQHVAWNRLLGCATLAIAALTTTGCAVRQDERNRTVIGLDTAAIFGTERARFTLTDGSEGSLRSQGDVYSIKLEKFHKVIPLGNARQMQFDQAFQIDGRTVVVIHLQNTSGCVKTQILSIRESQVLHWIVTPSDCKSVPTLAANAEQLVLSYFGSRFVYANARLVEEKAIEQAAPARDNPPAKNAPESLPTPRRTAKPATTSDEPRNLRTTSNKATKSTAHSPAPAPAVQRPAAAASVPELRFNRSAQEQKPTVITLE